MKKNDNEKLTTKVFRFFLEAKKEKFEQIKLDRKMPPKGKDKNHYFILENILKTTLIS